MSDTKKQKNILPHDKYSRQRQTALLAEGFHDVQTVDRPATDTPVCCKKDS